MVPPRWFDGEVEGGVLLQGGKDGKASWGSRYKSATVRKKAKVKKGLKMCHRK